MFLNGKVRNREILHTLYRKIYFLCCQRIPSSLLPAPSPHVVDLELTNDCNMSCPHCLRNSMRRPVGYMDFDLATKIIDEISSYAYCFLRFVGLGEPALHPRMSDILDYVKKKRIKVELTTNGTFLNAFSPEQILNWSIDIIGVSIDGWNESSYARLRAEGHYKELRRKVTALYEAKKRLGKHRPKIRVRSIVFPGYTAEQLALYKRDWLKVSDGVTFNTFIPPGRTRQSPPYQCCQDIFFTAHIRWDGRVPLCGYQYLYADDEEWLGTTSDTALADLWRHPRLQEVRKLHLKSDLSTIAFCTSCFRTQQKRLIRDNKTKYDALRNPVLSKLYRSFIRRMG